MKVGLANTPTRGARPRGGVALRHESRQGLRGDCGGSVAPIEQTGGQFRCASESPHGEFNEIITNVVVRGKKDRCCQMLLSSHSRASSKKVKRRRCFAFYVGEKLVLDAIVGVARSIERDIVVTDRGDTIEPIRAMHFNCLS